METVVHDAILSELLGLAQTALGCSIFRKGKEPKADPSLCAFQATATTWFSNSSSVEEYQLGWRYMKPFGECHPP